MSIPELSVQLKNIPGQLVQITSVLAEAEISIRGICATSSGKTGWVHMVVDQAKVAEEVLEDCGIAADVGEALAVVVGEDSGIFDHALRALADEKINVDYIYTCIHPNDGSVILILGVQSPSRAEKILKAVDIRIADLPGL